MEKEIIINSTNEDTRIALLEDKRLMELFVERPDYERQVGDIYKGKVRKVVKGMQAAFIDIGFKQDAFLHFSDIGSNVGQLFADIDEDELEGEGDTRSDVDPTSLLHKGQEIVVQIVKEPIANKGPRVSTELNIPGRFLVLLPRMRKIGISRKISSSAERKRLRNLMRKLLPKDFGLIIRTVAEGKDETALQQDLERLLQQWKELEKKIATAKPYTLLYKDLSMASSVIRDLFTDDVKRVVVDSRKMYRDIQKYLKEVSSDLHKRVEYYRGKQPIFDYFDIEKDIQRSIEKKVWMDNGGYLFIEQTEALAVVDVNSGRYFGRKDHERNSLKINLEAVREIARQIRLRDLGGLIVIDFIDMEENSNKKKVLNELQKEFARDRAVSKIEPMSRFGLVEMTRQRIRPSLIHNLYDPCPNCNGNGLVPSKGTILADVERAIRRYTASRLDRRLILKVHPEVDAYINDKPFGRRFKLMWKYWVKITTEVDETLKPHEFKLIEKRTGKDVTSLYAF
jgi:ribonuclease G